MRTLFKGGSVASAHGVRRADLLVEGEKVVSLGRGLKAEAERMRPLSRLHRCAHTF